MSMTMIHRLIAITALLALAACGGGGGNPGTNVFGGGGNSGGGGGGQPPAPTAADLTLVLSTPTISNSGTEAATATVTAVDANRNAIAGIPVTLSVDADATVQVAGTATNDSGRLTGSVSIGANKSNRTILVTATSGTLTRQVALQVVGTRLTATPLPAILLPSEAGRIQYRVVDSNNNAMPGTTIAVTGPTGVQTTAQTGANGDYEYTYTAPTAAGTAQFRATAAGVETVTSVVVQAGPGAIPQAGIVRSASVRANPSVVPVNLTATSANRAEIRALFVGDNNAPVQNVRVRFDLDGDRNSIGGSITSGTSTVFSDANGVAVTAYQPASRFSPTDGVTVRACWDRNDFPAGTCPNAATTTLTVISDALSVTIGTDEVIVLEDLVYVKRFIVQVNDSSGLAKPDVVVSPLLDLPRYFKGEWIRVGNAWDKTTRASCDNEDVNRNGVLEVYSNGFAEDANGNRQIDPRKADVSVSFEGSNRTDARGQAILRIVYPRSVASWLAYKLTVAATGVSGTEGRDDYDGVLPVPASAIASASDPAFRFSPYGLQTSPTTVITTPETPPVSATVCTNPN